MRHDSSTKPTHSISFFALAALTGCLALAATFVWASVDSPAGGGWSFGDRPSRAELPSPGLGVHAKAALADPVGDTFGTGSAIIDITNLAASVVDDGLLITVDFAEAPEAPDSGLDEALDGFIDLDLDQDGTTGQVPWIDFLRADGGDSGLGNEAYIDLFTFDSGTGTVEVIDESTQATLGDALASLVDTRLQILVPFDVMNDDGQVDLAAIVGTVGEVTDLAPNSGSLRSDLSTTVSLRDGRFTVDVEWLDFEGNRGPGRLVTQSDDSALLWFFGPDNWEVLVKVLDGCPVNDRWWVFFAATTNVGFELTVTDTASSQSKTYSNPLGQAADAITDTDAFATCP